MDEVSDFFWFAKPDEFDEETGRLDFTIASSGRLRHRWVPKDKEEARRFLKEHPDAAGLRAASNIYILIKVYLEEPLKDLTDNYPNASPEGLKGVVIRTPFDFSALKRRSKESPPPHYTHRQGSGDVIITSNIKEYSSAQVHMLTDDEIENQSVVEITNTEALTRDGDPIMGGPMDHRMGTLDMAPNRKDPSTSNNTKCPTCNLFIDAVNISNSCLGHFGHIELEVPIPKFLYLGKSAGKAEFVSPLMFALNTVCHSCYRISIPDKAIEEITPEVMNIFDSNKRHVKGRQHITKITGEAFKEYHKLTKFDGNPAWHREDCPHCGSFTPRMTFSHYKYACGDFKIEHPDKRYRPPGSQMTEDQSLPAISFGAARNILYNISNEDAYLLGMDPNHCRPEDLFFKKILVLPNNTRPMREIPLSGRMDVDDMTKLYQDVIYFNNRIRTNKRTANIKGIDLQTKKLYGAVSRLWDNRDKTIESGGDTQVWGYKGGVKTVSYKGIFNRWEGKRGRFRQNLQSKAVEEVSYSVISPDPDLDIDEVGVPQQICKEASFTEIVTEQNMKEMQQLILRGNQFPGARYIYLDGDAKGPDGDKIGLPGTVPKEHEQLFMDFWNHELTHSIDDSTGNVTINDKTFTAEEFIEYSKNRWLRNTANKLRIGSAIVRHIRDGDIGLFNRAPSLHRQSILAFRTKVIPTKSLTMNPTVCIPFNADYDGDAMKFHFVSTEIAKAEAEKLMSLSKNIIHARYGKLTVATDQDQTSGLYLLTNRNPRRGGKYVSISSPNRAHSRNGKYWNKSFTSKMEDGVRLYEGQIYTYDYHNGIGFTEDDKFGHGRGCVYFNKEQALSCYTTVYSKNRETNSIRMITTLPEPDYETPGGDPAYTGKNLFSHLFTILDADYVSATYEGNVPEVDDKGNVRYIKGKKIKERVKILNGKLIEGTLDKDTFGEGGASIAPSFIYHEGYERGTEKLVEYIELVTRLGLAGHRMVGFTMSIDQLVGSKETEKEIDREYDLACKEIMEVQESYNNKTLVEYAKKNKEDEIFADSQPDDFSEEMIVNIATKFEENILKPIEDLHGSENALQISVRSKARGKEENIRQMAGGHGIVLLGGKRIRSGINPNRVLSQYPMALLNSETDELDKVTHPKYAGFYKSNYSDGMKPDEYWFTSSAGRKSSYESTGAEIGKSGYLERMVLKSIESYVVNNRRQVVNLRTGRIVSPLVGEDGLSPYHIRGSHKDVNKDGLVLTLQPFFFDFECMHGKHLVDIIDNCKQCEGEYDSTAFEQELQSLEQDGVKISINTRNSVTDVIQKHKVSKPNQRKMANNLYNFYRDSLCRKGEGIGATAAGCIGEPATQAALRTFHFAGKLSFTGSVKRTKQMLTSPMTTSTPHYPRTKVFPLKEYNDKKFLTKLANMIRRVYADKIIKVIRYDIETSSLLIEFDMDKINLYGIDKDLVRIHIINSLKNGAKNGLFVSYQVMSDTIKGKEPFIIRIERADFSLRPLLYAKEVILNTAVSGYGKSSEVTVMEKKKGDGNWFIDIRAADITLLNNLIDDDLTGQYIDISRLETNNLRWIYGEYGLEAALNAFIDELDFQMNGDSGSKGVGEYDWRYIRTLADIMGEEGYIQALGPHGIGATANYSMMGGMSLEQMKAVFKSGTVMGNYDPLEGMAESIIVGKTTQVGHYAPN